jgi:hypothetical protein
MPYRFLPDPAVRAGWPMSISSHVAVLALLLGATACDDENTCSGGERCECAHFDDCYLECHDSNCSFRVHDLVHGGGVCDDGCQQSCFAVTDCSLSCGEDCTSDVHDVTSSGTLCGNGCAHQCFDLDRCAVGAGADSTIHCHNATTCEIEVGPGSYVQCDSVSTCRVKCSGDCGVHYTGVTGSPQVTCPSNAPRTECSPTLIACGACEGWES